ncbi:MAG: hypothetical protein ACLGHX_04945 [Acidimicrobiia bacterium]
MVGLAPRPWSIAFAVLWLAAVAAVFRSWRNTARTLMVSIAVFMAWVVGTLITR